MEVDRFRAFSHASVMRPKPGDQGKNLCSAEAKAYQRARRLFSWGGRAVAVVLRGSWWSRTAEVFPLIGHLNQKTGEHSMDKHYGFVHFFPFLFRNSRLLVGWLALITSIGLPAAGYAADNAPKASTALGLTLIWPCAPATARCSEPPGWSKPSTRTVSCSMRNEFGR